MRIVLIILGVVLTIWSGASALQRTLYAKDLPMEAKFCRFVVCDDSLLEAEGEQAMQGKKGTPQDAVASYRKLVAREPGWPFHWLNLGDSLWAAHRAHEAEYCFRQAVTLSPYWPPILARALNFHFGTEDVKTALSLGAQVLDRVSDYDADILSQYLKVDTRSVLEHGLPRHNPRPAREYLRYLMYNKPAEVAQAWTWIRARGFADSPTVNGYVAWLITRQPAEAPRVWREYLGDRAGEYGKSNYVFNGGFEDDFTGCLLDWTFQPTEGVEVVQDETNPDTGKWSLRVRFDGQHNVGATGLAEYVVLPPGRDVLQARIRTEGLTTDQGVQLRVPPLGASEAWLGTRGWTSVNIPVVVPGGDPKVFRIELARTPSMKFERNIGGTIWMDSVKILR